jgi:hypothetical protein
VSAKRKFLGARIVGEAEMIVRFSLLKRAVDEGEHGRLFIAAPVDHVGDIGHCVGVRIDNGEPYVLDSKLAQNPVLFSEWSTTLNFKSQLAFLREVSCKK